MAEPVNKQHIECVLNGLSELAANVALRAMVNLTDLQFTLKTSMPGC